MFAPPLPPSQQLTSSPLIPPSHITSDPLGQADLLRRELDSRFLAQQERSLGLGPGLGSLTAPPAFLRTEMHHHQHQHTHVHQHLLQHMGPPPPLPPPGTSGLFSHSATPSLFKEVNKVGLESSLYQPGGSLGSSYPPGLTPIVHPPTSTFAPPSHLSSVPPKIGEPSQRKPVKTGRWNAMHVRIAWEIYYHQQKQTPEKPGAKLGGPDLLRPPPGPGVGTTAGAPIFPTLPRPPDLGPSILAGPGPSHRFDSPLLGHHLTPSVPGLGGMRYPGGAPPGPSAPPPSGFHHVGVTPTSIPGPPPGSMFSRESLPPGLTVPQPTPHDAWRHRLYTHRIRAPTPYGPTPGPWPVKPDAAMYERERREEERQNREREERERREREERERREREERERREREERERREREERERERERERRAEHEKDRAVRSLETSHDRSVPRRDGSRSPLRPDPKDRPSSHPSAPGSSHPSLGAMPSSSMKADGRPDSRPGSRPGSRTLDPRVKLESKDEVMIVGGKEAPPRQIPHGVPPPSVLPPPVSVGLLPPHSIAMSMATTSANSALDRARLLGTSGYGSGGPHLGPWADPFRDPYRSAQEISVARVHDLGLLRDPLRERMNFAAAAREEQMLHSNPLSSLILSERYREQQQQQQQAAVARDLFERSHLAAGVPPGSMYPPTSALLPPHPSVSHMAPSLLKGGSPLGPGPPGGPHGLHPPGLGSLHGPGHPGAPPGHPQPPPLAPGLPPPLIPSMRGSSPAHPRPPDKKDDPR
nr:autism susceptibility gene 2 protein homolog [Penaeus vannamei]